MGCRRRRAAGLWAGHRTDAGCFVAGSSARAKAKRIGLVDERLEADERARRAEELKPKRETIRLLGRDIPVLPADDGTPRAVEEGNVRNTTPSGVPGA